MILAERTGPIPLMDISSSLLAVFRSSKPCRDLVFSRLKGAVSLETVLFLLKLKGSVEKYAKIGR